MPSDRIRLRPKPRFRFRVVHTPEASIVTVIASRDNFAGREHVGKIALDHDQFAAFAELFREGALQWEEPPDQLVGVNVCRPTVSRIPKTRAL